MKAVKLLQILRIGISMSSYCHTYIHLPSRSQCSSDQAKIVAPADVRKVSALCEGDAGCAEGCEGSGPGAVRAAAGRKAKEMKARADACVEATGVGAGGQMQRRRKKKMEGSRSGRGDFPWDGTAAGCIRNSLTTIR